MKIHNRASAARSREKQKQKGKGEGQMDMTQHFGEHSPSEKASEFSNYTKAKGCSEITLYKIWFVA